MALFEPGGALVAEATSSDDDELLTWVATSAGLHTLAVELVADGGSLPGNVYELEANVGPVLTCPLDDDPVWPYRYGFYSTPNGSRVDGIVLCPGDEEVFFAWLSPGDEVQVELQFEHDEGDIDLLQYSCWPVWPDSWAPYTCSTVASSTSSDDDELLTVSNPSSDYAAFGFRAVLASDDGLFEGNELSVVLTQLAGCVDDALENNDDWRERSWLDPGSYAGLTACEGDLDYYGVPLVAGDSLDAEIAFDPAEGDLDLHIYDGVALLASSTSSTGVESVSWTAADDGIYEVVVEMVAESGAPGAGYDLDLAFPVATCVEDTDEEDDDPTTATQLTVNPDYPSHFACPGDGDWYSYVLQVGQSWYTLVEFEHDAGDIDIFVYDAGLELVASGTSADDDELAFHVVAPGDAGTHYLQVVLISEADAVPGAHYGLVAGADAYATCLDDGLEHNDEPWTPVAVTEGSHPRLGSCPGDEDWYGLWLTAGQQVSVELAFVQVSGDLALGLYDPAGTLLAWSDTTTDVELASAVAVGDGYHLVGVFHVTETDVIQGNFYDMEVEVIP